MQHVCIERSPHISSLLLSFCGMDLYFQVANYVSLTSQAANSKPVLLPSSKALIHSSMCLSLIFKSCSVGLYQCSYS